MRTSFHCPEEQAGIELVIHQLAPRPPLAPDAKRMYERHEVLAGRCQVIRPTPSGGRPAPLNKPFCLQFPKAPRQECWRSPRNTALKLGKPRNAFPQIAQDQWCPPLAEHLCSFRDRTELPISSHRPFSFMLTERGRKAAGAGYYTSWSIQTQPARQPLAIRECPQLNNQGREK